MEFKVDFNEVKKSKFRYYSGFAMLIFSVILLFYSIYTFNIIFIFYFFYFSIMSFSHIYEGGGKSINSIFGERFLKINEEKIEVKEKSRRQSETIYWDNIESINFATTKVIINSKNKQKIEIKYEKLSYTIVQQLKETLSSIEKQKHLSKQQKSGADHILF